MERTNRPSLDLLKDKKNLIGAEIGVQTGINSLWMLMNLDIEKLYLIDPYEEYRCNNNKPINNGGMYPSSPDLRKSCLKLLKPWESKIEYIYKFSWDALSYFTDRSLDFVYVDGDHREESVLKDLSYTDKIKLGGLLCGHDWRFPSVQRAVNTFVSENRFEFNCCNSRQFINVLSRYEKESDWWINVPMETQKFKAKCKYCQKVINITTKDTKLYGV